MTEDVHTLTIYANDTAGNMAASTTIHFKVVQTTFPLSWVITILVAAVIVGVVWWGYRRTVKEEMV